MCLIPGSGIHGPCDDQAPSAPCPASRAAPPLKTSPCSGRIELLGQAGAAKAPLQKVVGEERLTSRLTRRPLPAGHSPITRTYCRQRMRSPRAWRAATCKGAARAPGRRVLRDEARAQQFERSRVTSDTIDGLLRNHQHRTASGWGNFPGGHAQLVLVLPDSIVTRKSIVGVLRRRSGGPLSPRRGRRRLRHPGARIYLAAYPRSSSPAAARDRGTRQHGFANQPAAGPSAARRIVAERDRIYSVDAPDHVSTKRRASTIVVERSFRTCRGEGPCGNGRRRGGWHPHPHLVRIERILVMTTASTPAAEHPGDMVRQPEPRKNARASPQIGRRGDRARAPRTPRSRRAWLRTAAYCGRERLPDQIRLGGFR